MGAAGEGFGTIVQVGIYPSWVVVTRLIMGKDFKEILEYQVKSHQVGTYRKYRRYKNKDSRETKIITYTFH